MERFFGKRLNIKSRPYTIRGIRKPKSHKHSFLVAFLNGMEQFRRQGSNSYSQSSNIYLQKLVPMACYIMTLLGTVCEVTNSSVCGDHIRLSVTYRKRQMVPRICMKLRVLFLYEKSWSDYELPEYLVSESY